MENQPGRLHRPGSLIAAHCSRLLFFLQTSLFRLQEIDIKGLHAIKEDEIITLSGIGLGANIFQVDRSAAKSKFCSMPWSPM